MHPFVHKVGRLSVRQGNLKTPQQLLADLAVSDLDLVTFYLKAAETAEKQQDEASRRLCLRKAFVTYCQVKVRISQLTAVDNLQLTAVLNDLHGKIQSAYFEEP